MNRLNELEIAILQAIIKDNQDSYPFLKVHFPYLFVKSREFTGVGEYSNFGYSKEVDESDINTQLTSSKRLLVDNLKYEVCYVLAITNGKIDFLEIVTNGNESLDEKIINFKLV